MKVRLLKDRAGTDFHQSAGEVVDVPDSVGQRMVDMGRVELVQTGKPKPIETASMKSGKRERKGPAKRKRGARKK